MFLKWLTKQHFNVEIFFFLMVVLLSVTNNVSEENTVDLLHTVLIDYPIVKISIEIINALKTILSKRS